MRMKKNPPTTITTSHQSKAETTKSEEGVESSQVKRIPQVVPTHTTDFVSQSIQGLWVRNGNSTDSHFGPKRERDRLIFHSDIAKKGEHGSGDRVVFSR